MLRLVGAVWLYCDPSHVAELPRRWRTHKAAGTLGLLVGLIRAHMPRAGILENVLHFAHCDEDDECSPLVELVAELTSMGYAVWHGVADLATVHAVRRNRLLCRKAFNATTPSYNRC